MKLLARGTYIGTGKDIHIPIPPHTAIVIVKPYDKRENRHDRKRKERTI